MNAVMFLLWILNIAEFSTLDNKFIFKWTKN